MAIVGLLGRLSADDQAKMRAVGDFELRDLSNLVRLEKASRRPDAPAEAAGASAKLDEALADCDALFAWEAVSKLGARTPKLRWVQSTWAGVDFLNGTGIIERDITLTTGSGVTAPAIAEWVLGAIYALAKNFPTYVRQQADRSWKRVPADDVAGRTVVLYGLGSIGQETARLASAVGMRVLASRRSPGEAVPGVERIVPSAEFDSLLPEADYLVLAAPLTPETKGVIGKEQLAAMKPTARLINVGRGALVDEMAMVEALRSGGIAAAALDVFEVEPLPADHPLWDLQNVIISPHISASNTNFQERLLDLFCDNLRRFLAGQPLRNVYNRERGY